MLLVARTSDHSLQLLDPLQKAAYSENMCRTIVRFLQRECRRYSPDLSAWGDTFIQPNTETAPFGTVESGLYVMKRAEGFARCCVCDLETGALQGYGAYVLEKLVRASLHHAN